MMTSANNMKVGGATSKDIFDYLFDLGAEKFLSEKGKQQQQQQQLLNSFRLFGVWRDPDVYEFIPMRTRHTKRPVPTDPQKNIFDKKIKYFENVLQIQQTNKGFT